MPVIDFAISIVPECKTDRDRPLRPDRERPERPDRHPIKEALFLHNDQFGNATFEDCVWRREREPCPDPDVRLHLYTEAEPVKKPVSTYYNNDEQ